MMEQKTPVTFMCAGCGIGLTVKVKWATLDEENAQAVHLAQAKGWQVAEGDFYAPVLCPKCKEAQ